MWMPALFQGSLWHYDGHKSKLNVCMFHYIALKTTEVAVLILKNNKMEA